MIQGHVVDRNVSLPPVFLKLPGQKNKMAEKKPSKTNLLDDLKLDKTESPLDFLCK